MLYHTYDTEDLLLKQNRNILGNGWTRIKASTIKTMQIYLTIQKVLNNNRDKIDTIIVFFVKRQDKIVDADGCEA